MVVDLTPRNPEGDGAMAGVSAWSHSPYLASGLGLDMHFRPSILWAECPPHGLTSRQLELTARQLGLTARHMG